MRECAGKENNLIPGIFYFFLSHYYFNCCHEVVFLSLSATGFKYLSNIYFVRFGVGKGLHFGFILLFYSGSL